MPDHYSIKAYLKAAKNPAIVDDAHLLDVFETIFSLLAERYNCTIAERIMYLQERYNYNFYDQCQCEKCRSDNSDIELGEDSDAGETDIHDM